MTLQEGGGNLICNLSFHRLVDDSGFPFTPGHHDDAFGFQNGTHTHGDGLAGNVLLTKKITGCIKACDLIEADQTGKGSLSAAGFIETNMTSAANAQNLKVYSSQPGDFFFVSLTKCFYLFSVEGSVWDVDVFGWNVCYFSF